MKKILLILCAFLFMFGQNVSAKPYLISVNQFVEHPALDAVLKGFQDYLKENNIQAEFTATERTGFHKYTFPSSEEAHLILDLTSGIYNYDGKVVWASIRVENDTLVTGFRQTHGWARTRYLYFAMTLSIACPPIRKSAVIDRASRAVSL